VKLLIIGSKGFIGSHCATILSIENEVYGCDVVNDYINKNYYQVDATNADYKAIFKDRDFDICINCSGAASVPDSFKNPLKDFSLNTFNVIKILEAIKEFQPSC
jgi:UDP-glucose 4-epimerase